MEKQTFEQPRGVCPVCNGTRRKPCPDDMRVYGVKNGWFGYNKETDTVDCDNCGKQYMMGRPLGTVPLNHDGVPCTHAYVGKTVSNCYTRYTCKHCDDTHYIDSGD